MIANRAALAEFVGTAFLLLAVVGSGIMAQRLCGGNIGVALLANAIATSGALIALILAFGPISGAHFNPAVTIARSLTDTFAGIRPADMPLFIAAQLFGAFAATALFAYLSPISKATAQAVVIAHPEEALWKNA